MIWPEAAAKAEGDLADLGRQGINRTDEANTGPGSDQGLSVPGGDSEGHDTGTRPGESGGDDPADSTKGDPAEAETDEEVQP